MLLMNEFEAADAATCGVMPDVFGEYTPTF
jgi:hypothetical protein